MHRIAILLLPLLFGCYTNPQKKAECEKREMQALQQQLSKVSRLDSVVCKTVLDFKLPSCFFAPELRSKENANLLRSVEACSNCKLVDASFLNDKEYYSLNVELRKSKGNPLQLFIGYIFRSTAPEKHGLGILYDLVKSKDSLYVNHSAVPKQWME